jgi:HD-GYP domain-containing protein (c-di-GMP phosphodiesterase class II)
MTAGCPPDDISSAQRRLGYVIERASIGEDRQLARKVREKGEAFVQILYGTMRMTRMYEINNETFERPIKEIGTLLSWLVEQLGTVHLVAVEGQVYINDVRIRFKTADQADSKLGEDLARHNVGSITFHEPIGDDKMLALLALLGTLEARREGRRAAVVTKLRDLQIDSVELGGINRYITDDDQIETNWSEVLDRAVEAVEETWANVTAGRALNPLSLRRVVVEVLAAGIESIEFWQSAASGEEHAQHAVRVMRICLVIGQQLGLPPKALQDLGIAALVHDLGYAKAPGDSAIDLAGHLGRGALVMLRQRGFHDAKLQRILVALYHHHNHRDLIGVPSLFARIVRLAEDYDNLSRKSAGGKSPATALALMASGAMTAYDPVLLQLMINRLGRYPPGTTLLLDDGRRVRSVSLATESTFALPTVQASDGRVFALNPSDRIARVLE